MAIFADKMTDFSTILADALELVAAEHGLSYPPGGAQAWGRTGAAYVSYALATFSAPALRSLQTASRELYGQVLLDCKWYDRMVGLCLGGQEQTTAVIPAGQDAASLQVVTKSLFLEMLDFLREG